MRSGKAMNGGKLAAAIMFCAGVLGAVPGTAQETTNTWIVSDGATLDTDIDFTGTTPAQTTAETTGTFLSSATLSTIIYYSVDDNTLECGTLNPGFSTSCQAPNNTTGEGEASITVQANVPWELTITDDAEGTNEAVTFLSDDVAFMGTVQAPIVTDPATLGDATNATKVRFSGGTFPATEPESLTYADGSGTMSGYFTVTIAAQ